MTQLFALLLYICIAFAQQDTFSIFAPSSSNPTQSEDQAPTSDDTPSVFLPEVKVENVESNTPDNLAIDIPDNPTAITIPLEFVQSPTQEESIESEEFELPLTYEPITQFAAGDYEEGENLGAYLLDTAEDQNVSMSDVATFLEIISDLGVLEELCLLGSLTVFAPNEKAFEDFFRAQELTLNEINKFESNRNIIKQVLRTHIVRAQIIDITPTGQYVTLNVAQLLEVQLKEGDASSNFDQIYVINTSKTSAEVLGAVFSAVGCGDFNVAAIVIDRVLVPDNV
eukprot:TRINITY_DN3532_c0_g4_i1.p2 TRINITY_DN3532_c0_g4~~TRINITY_DN3532_c0_g4_i1.p2  ORF type:complete len:283 (+),score=39.82 TRINITY_DN3532_c0_g4_i1:131-979(+)